MLTLISCFTLIPFHFFSCAEVSLLDCCHFPIIVPFHCCISGLHSLNTNFGYGAIEKPLTKHQIFNQIETVAFTLEWVWVWLLALLVCRLSCCDSKAEVTLSCFRVGWAALVLNKWRWCFSVYSVCWKLKAYDDDLKPWNGFAPAISMGKIFVFNSVNTHSYLTETLENQSEPAEVMWAHCLCLAVVYIDLTNLTSLIKPERKKKILVLIGSLRSSKVRLKSNLCVEVLIWMCQWPNSVFLHLSLKCVAFISESLLTDMFFCQGFVYFQSPQLSCAHAAQPTTVSPSHYLEKAFLWPPWLEYLD